jgi:flagellar motility protein MotE (MotC chaperone)
MPSWFPRIAAGAAVAAGLLAASDRMWSTGFGVADALPEAIGTARAADPPPQQPAPQGTPQGGRGDTTIRAGFGPHDRPWTRDLLKEQHEAPKAVETGEGKLPPGFVLPGSALACETTPELMAMISEREQGLSQREARVTELESLVKAAEVRLQSEREAFSKERERFEELVAEQRRMREEDVRQIVTVYETMKPRDAAGILNELDVESAVRVLTRMNERKSSAIISAMSRERAQTVTQAMLKRRELPEGQPR